MTFDKQFVVLFQISNCGDLWPRPFFKPKLQCKQQDNNRTTTGCGLWRDPCKGKTNNPRQYHFIRSCRAFAIFLFIKPYNHGNIIMHVIISIYIACTMICTIFTSFGNVFVSIPVNK